MNKRTIRMIATWLVVTLANVYGILVGAYECPIWVLVVSGVIIGFCATSVSQIE